MLILRRLLCLTIACSTLLTSSYPAHGAATKSAEGQIQATNDDIREVVADNAALVAEIEAIRQALAEERESTSALVSGMNEYIAAADAEKAALKEQSGILQELAGAQERKAKAERQKGLGKLILGLVIGGVVGAAFAD